MHCTLHRDADQLSPDISLLDTVCLDKPMNPRFRMTRAVGLPCRCRGDSFALAPALHCIFRRIVITTLSQAKAMMASNPSRTAQLSSAAASNEDRRTRPTCLACLSHQLPAKRGSRLSSRQTSRHAKTPNQPHFLHHACAFATAWCWCPE